MRLVNRIEYGIDYSFDSVRTAVSQEARLMKGTICSVVGGIETLGCRGTRETRAGLWPYEYGLTLKKVRTHLMESGT